MNVHIPAARWSKVSDTNTLRKSFNFSIPCFEKGYSINSSFEDWEERTDGQNLRHSVHKGWPESSSCSISWISCNHLGHHWPCISAFVPAMATRKNIILKWKQKICGCQILWLLNSRQKNKHIPTPSSFSLLPSKIISFKIGWGFPYSAGIFSLERRQEKVRFLNWSYLDCLRKETEFQANCIRSLCCRLNLNRMVNWGKAKSKTYSQNKL